MLRPINAAISCTVRCEMCGYEIDSVLREAGPASPCPECGTALLESSPERRIGSTWQRRRSPFGYAATLWSTLGRGPELFRRLSLEGGGAWSLLVITCLVSSTAMLAPWSGVFIADPIRRLRFARSGEHVARIFGWLFAEIGALALLLGVLSMLIGLGLKTLGAPRGWRHTGATVHLIAAHAAVGWLVVAAGIWTMLTFWFVATLVATQSEGSGRVISQISGWLATHGGRIGPWTLPVAIVGLGAGAVAWLTWIGLRETRYANEPGTARLFEAGETGGGKAATSAGLGAARVTGMGA